jgi:hypothetical protein
MPLSVNGLPARFQLLILVLLNFGSRIQVCDPRCACARLLRLCGVTLFRLEPPIGFN